MNSHAPGARPATSPATSLTTSPRRIPVVPVVALATTALLQTVQFLSMQIAGSRRGMSLTEVLMQWDSQWMTLISRHGYSGFSMGTAGQPGGEPIQWQSVAFFPGYPFLVRTVAAPVRFLTGAEITSGAAVGVSVVASFLMVWGLGRLAVDVLWPRVRGMRGRQDDATVTPAGPVTEGLLTASAGVLALGAPMAVVYVMPYSESLFTALSVWTVYMLLRGRHLTAGVLVFLAGLTRITAVVLVLTLFVAAVVELWHWWRAGRGADTAGRVERACAAPVIGALGTAGYIIWANRQTAEIGGYFAAQERGWHSGFDFGVATWEWVTTRPLNIFSHGVDDGTMPGYAISGWSMILVAVLCAVSLWPLLTGTIPWQLWLPAVAVAGMTLGSDGIMHSRPRLLLIPVLFLLLPAVVRGVRAVRSGAVRRPWLAGVPVVVGVTWCVAGTLVSAAMLVDFAYAI